jgi:hypothetical protein
MIFTSVTWHLYHGLHRSPARTNGTGNRMSAMIVGSEVVRSAFTNYCYLRLDRRIKVTVRFPQFLKLPKFCCETTGIWIQFTTMIFLGGGGGANWWESPRLVQTRLEFCTRRKTFQDHFCWFVVRLHDHFQYVVNYWLNTALWIKLN